LKKKKSLQIFFNSWDTIRRTCIPLVVAPGNKRRGRKSVKYVYFNILYFYYLFLVKKKSERGIPLCALGEEIQPNRRNKIKALYLSILLSLPPPPPPPAVSFVQMHKIH